MAGSRFVLAFFDRSRRRRARSPEGRTTHANATQPNDYRALREGTILGRIESVRFLDTNLNVSELRHAMIVLRNHLVDVLLLGGLPGDIFEVVETIVTQQVQGQLRTIG